MANGGIPRTGVDVTFLVVQSLFAHQIFVEL